MLDLEAFVLHLARHLLGSGAVKRALSVGDENGVEDNDNKKDDTKTKKQAGVGGGGAASGCATGGGARTAPPATTRLYWQSPLLVPVDDAAKRLRVDAGASSAEDEAPLVFLSAAFAFDPPEGAADSRRGRRRRRHRVRLQFGGLAYQQQERPDQKGQSGREAGDDSDWNDSDRCSDSDDDGATALYYTARPVTVQDLESHFGALGVDVPSTPPHVLAKCMADALRGLSLSGSSGAQQRRDTTINVVGDDKKNRGGDVFLPLSYDDLGQSSKLYLTKKGRRGRVSRIDSHVLSVMVFNWTMPTLPRSASEEITDAAVVAAGVDDELERQSLEEAFESWKTLVDAEVDTLTTSPCLTGTKKLASSSPPGSVSSPITAASPTANAKPGEPSATVAARAAVPPVAAIKKRTHGYSRIVPAKKKKKGKLKFAGS